MLGRASEASLVESLVRDARGGLSGSLLVSGEPGIGKTALLAHARTAAEGALVLEATGAEGESHLAFAGLADLLAPLFARIDELPDAQGAALRGALALGPPVPGDRFTAYAATLSLLAAGADVRPLMCILDDAHWLDAESLDAVQFAARRLGAEDIAILMGAREGLNARVDGSPLPRLRLEGLGRADSAALIAEHASSPPAPDVLAALVRGARGNPLALVELATALSPRQLAGIEPLPDPLPVGPYLQDALLRPVLALPEATRRALVVLSADDGTTGFLAAALAAEGLTIADLERAERAGVVGIGPTRAMFSHPLVRAAVYQAAEAPERRRAHRAHAASAAAIGESALDRRAWHLALAATGPEEAAAAELEAAALRATARNGHAAACEALEAAARLSPDVRERGRRLLASGQGALAAGEFVRAGRLFDEVAALDADPAQALEALVGRGYVETFGGSARRAVDLLVAAAERLEAQSPAGAAALLIQASVPCAMLTDLRRSASLAERATALAASAPPPVAAMADVAGAVVSTFSGRPAEASPESMAELSRSVAAGDPISFVWLQGSFQALMLMERYDEALAGLDEVVRAARQRSTPSVLPLPLFTRAEVRRRTGRVDLALADAAECVRLAEDTGQETASGLGRFTIAALDAVRGRAEACRAGAAEMIAACARTEAESLLLFADYALGMLALGAGDLDGAVEHLGSADRRRREGGGFHHPLMDAYEQDLAEALIRLGRPADAAEVLATLDAEARSTATRWPAAAVARCRGLMAADDEFEEHFAEALALHARTPTPFERARTELCLGERRRRARRVRDARAPLAASLETFEALGADPWAESARRELRAAGARPRRAPAAESDDLTPQELQVALIVAEGATNKEAASALLLSPKTVEYHLAKVYAKLGVRSRAQLARRMTSGAVSPLGPGQPD